MNGGFALFFGKKTIFGLGIFPERFTFAAENGIITDKLVYYVKIFPQGMACPDQRDDEDIVPYRI